MVFTREEELTLLLEKVPEILEVFTRCGTQSPRHDGLAPWPPWFA
ncbi:unnamed protein product [Ectocarpus sp. 6 AP-2014]